MPPIANLGDLAHLHLLLNHVPTIGTVLGLGLFLLSFVRKNDLTKVSLEVLFIIGLAALPVFLSGVAAQAALKDSPGVSAAAIATHENAALLAFILMEITAAVAWLGLWQIRRLARPTRPNLGTVLVLSVVTVGVMAWAANLGGDIRHPEILTLVGHSIHIRWSCTGWSRTTSAQQQEMAVSLVTMVGTPGRSPAQGWPITTCGA